jgi:hypothetical protein
LLKKYLDQLGFEAFECDSEEEAREKSAELIKQRKWPCYFFQSDTTGEKDFEEFFTQNEVLEMNRFSSIGVIKNEPIFDEEALTFFEHRITEIKNSESWCRKEIVELFHDMIPNFGHKEMGKFLDQKM